MANEMAESSVGFVICPHYEPSARAVVYAGSCLDLLQQIPDKSVQLVVTSPPYNIGKAYEKKLNLDEYLSQQKAVIEQCVRVMSDTGSICWQVGNHVTDGAIIPLDTLLYPIFAGLGLVMRNRIIWHFEHGLHCSRRFSGRYETIMWFSRPGKNYLFNLDPVRIPQKYPGKKYFKGPRAGEYSCNPLGKNPGDLWDIPNVKSNHVEKTEHPCQFPVELVERLVLSLTKPGDCVLDPFLGSGTSIIAALRHDRRGMGAEIVASYREIAQSRIVAAANGSLATRPMGKPKFDPALAGGGLKTAPWLTQLTPETTQLRLLEPKSPAYQP